MREPSPAHKAECEYDAPDRPVCKHADPHRDRSEAVDAAEINAQRHRNAHILMQERIIENLTSPAARIPYAGINASVQTIGFTTVIHPTM